MESDVVLGPNLDIHTCNELVSYVYESLAFNGIWCPCCDYVDIQMWQCENDCIYCGTDDMIRIFHLLLTEQYTRIEKEWCAYALLLCAANDLNVAAKALIDVHHSDNAKAVSVPNAIYLAYSLGHMRTGRVLLMWTSSSDNDLLTLIKMDGESACLYAERVLIYYRRNAADWALRQDYMSKVYMVNAEYFDIVFNAFMDDYYNECRKRGNDPYLGNHPVYLLRNAVLNSYRINILDGVNIESGLSKL